MHQLHHCLEFCLVSLVSIHENIRELETSREIEKKLEFQCMGCVLGGKAGPQPELEKFVDTWFSADDLVEAAEKSAIFKI